MAISRYEGDSTHSENKTPATRIALRINAVRPLVIVDGLGRIPFMKDKMPRTAVIAASQSGGVRSSHTNKARKKIVPMPRSMNKKLFRFLMSGTWLIERRARRAAAAAACTPLTLDRGRVLLCERPEVRE